MGLKFAKTHLMHFMKNIAVVLALATFVACGKAPALQLGPAANSSRQTTSAQNQGAQPSQQTVPPANSGTPSQPASTTGNPYSFPNSNLVDLSMGNVMSQGNTNWCWAYSAFHAMRGYYFSAQQNDAKATAWKNALTQLNSNSAFASFLSKNVSPGQLGDPENFVEIMQQSFNLPDPGWRDYASYQTGQAALMSKIDNNLRNGIPSVWCDRTHCMAVTGLSGSTATSTQYRVSDSSSGRLITMSYSQLVYNLDVVMML